MNYQSEVACHSEMEPGVTFRILRMSFGRRLELLERVRSLVRDQEFHEAGAELLDRVEGARQAVVIDRCFWDWGLLGVSGIEIDGAPGTPESLWKCGPEPLVKEILERIKRETGLSEDERKN